MSLSLTVVFYQRQPPGRSGPRGTAVAVGVRDAVGTFGGAHGMGRSHPPVAVRLAVCDAQAGALNVSDDPATVDRIRHLLGGRRTIVEKTMMGARIFMADGHMCCGLNRAGLMVRVGPDAVAGLLDLPHTRPFEVGKRRPLGYVTIDHDGYTTDAALARWIQYGIDYVASLPAKRPREKVRRRQG